MIVGCVKEIKNQEHRVGITPDNARAYVEGGNTVYIEKNAGIGSGFANTEYIEAGAQILDTAEEVWAKADMIVKVKEPLPQEFKFFREGLLIYTYFHLAADEELTKELRDAGVISIAYETLQEKDGSLPLLVPMSQIAGRLSLQEGAKYLEKKYGGEGVLLAGVPGTPKANVVILGTGTVGCNACKLAVGMGANVTIIGRNLHKLEVLDDQYHSSIQTLYSSDSNIEKACRDADLVIGAVLVPGAAAPKLFKKRYLKEMKPGSVFVDVSIDQGGCGESSRVTSHDDPIYIEDGVIHYCVGNMPGAVPRTSTIALTNATVKYGLQIANKGLKKACEENSAIYSAINTFGGKVVCKGVADAFGMECSDIRGLL